MSIILDALNKSEQERQQPELAPGLYSGHEASNQPGPVWKNWLWPALAVFFAALALSFWLGGRSAAPMPLPDATVSESPEPSSTLEERVPVVPPGVTEQVAPIAQPDPRAESSAAQTTGEIAQLYARNEQVDAAPRKQISQPQQVAEPPPETVSVEPDIPAADQELDVDALTRAARQELAVVAQQDEAPLVEHAAPLVADLRQSIKDEIPTIFYTSHNWSTVPGERQVVLNGEVRKEGDQVKPSLRLVQILEDSIVLDFRGTEFRLRSLNSWVNL